MNAAQAKRIPLAAVLAKLGHAPVRTVKDELWYRSPFRAETTPSFKVDAARNLWFDFGEGNGGTVLDLVMRHEGLAGLPAVLRRLEAWDLEPGPQPPPAAGRDAREPEPTHPVAPPAPGFAVTPLRHPALRAYLAGRGIPGALAREFVRELHETRNGKPYFALAFANDAGGYEIRNAYLKGCRGPKAVTTLGAGVPGAPLAVFEGFLDFLSAVAAGLLARPLPPVLVLNSNALKAHALAVIRNAEPAAVELYLDHDPSGRELTAWFREQLGRSGITVADRSGRYSGHKDLNDWFISRRHPTLG